MRSLSTAWFRLSERPERGASLAEYGLVVILVAIVALVAVAFMGVQVSSTYDVIADSLADVSS
jgi:Flp pilus assembly pilin Flp